MTFNTQHVLLFILLCIDVISCLLFQSTNSLKVRILVLFAPNWQSKSLPIWWWWNGHGWQRRGRPCRKGEKRMKIMSSIQEKRKWEHISSQRQFLQSSWRLGRVLPWLHFMPLDLNQSNLLFFNLIIFSSLIAAFSRLKRFFLFCY